ncbi:hypothetical protein NQ317_003339 [Molorchus minor]|uniref:Peptidase S1 domain-containing protein n=1 Tax=Molorchus minor TaxID=1323400 RepID=A0ABQ9JDZ9_9CUCU|nr:hypothetical protein NQ317_003339 [Molorchus minor]
MFLRYLVCFGFLLMLKVTAGQMFSRTPDPRILDGHEVEPHSIPYQAFLNITLEGETWRICGGAVITENYIVTSAGCMFGATSVLVILGAHNVTYKEVSQVRFETDKFLIHPGYTTDVGTGFVHVKDLAIISIPDTVRFNDVIGTIALPNPFEYHFYVNKTGTVSGWGLTDPENPTSYSPDLKNYDICLESNDTQSPCIGDIGSPLVVGDLLVGIAAQGIDKCEPGTPFIFSRISDFYSFITENTDYEDEYTSSTVAVTTQPPRTVTIKPVTTPMTSTTTEAKALSVSSLISAMISILFFASPKMKFFASCIFIVLALLNSPEKGTSQQYPSNVFEPRIIGGNEVDAHSIPYQVFLNITGEDNTTWYCGGSLITTNYVLTAGSCCDKASSIQIILGAHNVTFKEISQVRLNTTSFTIHPYFIYENYINIAVINLPKPVNFNRVIQPVRLPNPYESTDFTNKTGKVTGWGSRDPYNTNSYPQVLLGEEGRIMGKWECINEDTYAFIDICLDETSSNSVCTGDIGSPLTVDNVQVGIASRGVDGVDPCEPGHPFIFTPVGTYLDWIKEVTDYTDEYTSTTSTTGSPGTTIETTHTISSTLLVETTTEEVITTTSKAPGGVFQHGANFLPNLGLSIIGGYEVEPHSLPYQAFLNVTGENGRTWICGGSLITRNYVLTAGRCCDGYSGGSASTIEVILGAHKVTTEESSQVRISSQNFTVHPEFSMIVTNIVYENDIAVIAFADPVELNDAIQTVQLANLNDRNTFTNHTGRICGWGLTDAYNFTSYSEVLLAEEHSVIENQECRETYDGLQTYDVCMETNNSDSPCIGDYGSPLIVDGIQVGVASQNMAECVPGYPFIYTRVTDFFIWIKQVTDYEYITSTTPGTSTEITDSSSIRSSSTAGVDTTTETISTTPDKGSNIILHSVHYYFVMMLVLKLVIVFN